LWLRIGFAALRCAGVTDCDRLQPREAFAIAKRKSMRWRFQHLLLFKYLPTITGTQKKTRRRVSLPMHQIGDDEMNWLRTVVEYWRRWNALI
jgi:hypothetical protein